MNWQPVRLQRLFVILLVSYAIFAASGVLAKRFLPIYGDFPYDADTQGTITAVTSEGANDGLFIGDRIDYAKLRLADRYQNVRQPLSGVRVALPVIHNGKYRVVTVTATPTHFTTARKVTTLIKDMAWLFFVLVSARVLLLRMSALTWSFFIFALGNTQDTPGYLSLLPPVAFYFCYFLVALLSWSAILSLVLFAARFPDNRTVLHPALIRRAICSMFVVAALYGIYIVVKAAIGLLSWFGLVYATLYPIIPLYVCAWIALLVSYRKLHAYDRLRVRWAVGGIFLATMAAGTTLAALTLNLGEQFLYYEEALVAFSNVTIPIAMTYAIIRHRVVDVQFVANRAIVFAAVVILAAWVFAGLDWLFVNALPRSHTVIAVALGVVALAGYYSVQSFGQLIRLVDRLLFPQRHAAMQTAQELSRSLETQGDERLIEVALTVEACRVFQLTSAAIFRSSGDGGFVRRHAYGWPKGTAWHLFPQDPIVQRVLESRSQKLSTTERDWIGLDLPDGFAQPGLIIPVMHGRKVVAIVAYGAHVNGTDVDPAEAAALIALCTAAAPVYMNATPVLHTARLTWTFNS